MKPTVIFDLDGTLLDTLTDLHASVNHALALHSMPLRTTREIRSFLGNGIRNLVERSVSESCTAELFEKVFADFTAHYILHSSDHTAPYSGIDSLLSRLYADGYTMAIVSNKLHQAVEELNEKFFSRYISVAIGESPEVKRKPAPDTVLSALALLDSKADEAIYVGDSEVDIATARNSELPCISVTWGFRDKEELISAGATKIADNTEELYNAIKSHFDR